MKKFKIIRYIYLGVIGVIILFLGIFLIGSLTSKKPYTQVLGLSFFEVQSYSMYPEITKGDLLIVKKRKAENYEVGMTVTYIRPNEEKSTTHQIVKIEDKMITTRGIANDHDDEPFDVSCIIGEVVVVWSGYNGVRNFITNPLGIVSIILIGIFFIEGFNYLEEEAKRKRIEELKKELEEDK